MFCSSHPFAVSVRNCSTQTFLACPSSSVCTEIRADVPDGKCKCQPRTKFNPNYHDDSEYCVPSEEKAPADENAPNETHKADDTSSKPADPMPNDGIKTISQSPSAHHVAAGILIPILLVFIVIGTVFMYKKLHITHRVRNIRRTRRSRPFYEDVMLANNDNDDPPLI